MQSVLQTAPISPTTLWAGRIMSIVVVLFLLLSSIVKVMNLDPAVEGTAQLGYPASLVRIIGLIELGCLVLYIIPRTSVLGAILLTGYLGGAIATHVRILDTASIVMPLILGVLLWGGLFLRDERLRALIPLRRSSAQ